MTFTSPIHNPTLFGHDEAMRHIADAYKSGRMHHAWLISGMEGIGKMTLAYHIARYVLSHGTSDIGNLDFQHPVSKLIAAEAHPDMIVVSRATDEKTGELRNVIVVDDVLRISSFLHKTSTHGGWRVVIIDEAHTLNRFGQNALLKILEEPPSRTLILITVTTPGALLPTIRSRCRVLSLAPLDTPHMRTILKQAQPDLTPEAMDHLIRLAAGSVGFALKILRTETLPLYDELIALLEAPKQDIVRLHKLSDQIARKADAESFDVLTTLLVDYLRRLVHTQALKESHSYRLEKLLPLWDKVQSTFSMADTANLDRKLAFLNARHELRIPSEADLLCDDPHFLCKRCPPHWTCLYVCGL
jgi:DNA polymerase-3 subunit delta'